MKGSQRDWVSEVFKQIVMEDACKWVAERSVGSTANMFSDLPPLYESALEPAEYADALRTGTRDAK